MEYFFEKSAMSLWIWEPGTLFCLFGANPSVRSQTSANTIRCLNFARKEFPTPLTIWYQKMYLFRFCIGPKTQVSVRARGHAKDSARSNTRYPGVESALFGVPNI